MRFVNLCPHPMNIRVSDGSVIIVAMGPSVARRAVIDSTPEAAETDVGTVLVSTNTLGDVTGLPDSVDGVVYLVSALVRTAPKCVHRVDLASPGLTTRDESGKIVIAETLAFNPPGFWYN